MKNRYLSILTGVALATTASLAFAEDKPEASATTDSAAESESKPESKTPQKPKGAPGQGQRGQFFQRLDTNKDGKISSADQPPAQAWERIKKADQNGDGAVTQQELMAAMQSGTAGGQRPGGGNIFAMMLQRLDTDKDGKISQTEAGERWARMQQMDKDKNGFLEESEFPKTMPGRGTGPNSGNTGGNRGQFFANADKNKDDKLTQDEVPAQAWERLQKLDANKDGAVSKEEMAALAQYQKSQQAKKSEGDAAPKGGQLPKRPPTEGEDS